MPRNDGWEIEDEALPRARGVGFDAAVELAGLPYVRLTQRVEPPRSQRDRRRFWMLLASVLLAHAVLALLLYLALRPAPRHRRANVIAVTLIEPTAELPPPPPLVAPPPLQGRPAPVAPPPRRHYVPPAKGAISATMENSQGKSLDLYGANGEVRLPPGAPAAAATAAYVTPSLKGSQIYNGKSPVPYTPTPFAKDFEPTNQSLGQKTIGRAAQKVMEKTTVHKTIHLPGGIKVHCAVSLLALGGGCRGDAPQPPPKNDDDVRLSLPPAETLTGKKVVVPELEHRNEQSKDREPCPLQSRDAKATGSSRKACRNPQPLPASGRS
ncbi:MAG TPA: hypothetical protein VF284_10360 [Rhodanobacteraceae bacterium]